MKRLFAFTRNYAHFVLGALLGVLVMRGIAHLLKENGLPCLSKLCLGQ